MKPPGLASESCLGFYFGDLTRRKRKKRRKGAKDLEEAMLPEASSRRSKSSRRKSYSRSRSKPQRSGSASRRGESSRSTTKTTVQPNIPSAGSVDSAEHSGVYDLTTTTPQDTSDNRQQLV